MSNQGRIMGLYVTRISHSEIEVLEEQVQSFLDLKVYPSGRNYKVVLNGNTLFIETSRTAYYFLKGLLMGRER